MKFKANSNKVVSLGSRKLATFKGGFYETSDAKEIELLEKAKNVTKVTVVKASSKKQASK